MRKTLQLFFLTFLGISSFAQFGDPQPHDPETFCNRIPKISVGETTVITSAAAAQCSNCYDWDINNNSTSSDNQTVGNIKIVGSDMNQSVTIQAVGTGSYSVRLTYFNETGCHVVDYCGTIDNCSVSNLPGCFGFDAVNGYANLYYAYLGSPYQAPVGDECFTYHWYIKYQNGTLLEFDVENPQFNIDCENNPVIAYGLYVYKNGVQVKRYYTGGPTAIPEISGPQTPACSINACTPLYSRENKILVYPNPTSSVVNFEGENLSEYKIEVSDDKGSKVLDRTNLKNGIDLKNKKSGVYYYKITSKTGYFQAGKVIKK
ncbi:T9SS type A sorting domain-containing protein [Chryseobacterium sp. FH1]|uniref:T9SS type A sorting domain-containing protein n=1 Tax=Chryseobacterium sp. FH1 TaxID=1233951 RepID=UPI0004E405CF|nr:T9SS type A sorting domain-containing protein [Chryseobacterium sp. FH1]KFC19304.1 hypothetical protein IO90_08315 [Chryseobacterium sp. FH1]